MAFRLCFPSWIWTAMILFQQSFSQIIRPPQHMLFTMQLCTSCSVVNLSLTQCLISEKNLKLTKYASHLSGMHEESVASP
ncbi:hypothetical protein B0I35DRAFT_444720 [Stachybotrys elegans]|uniref:Secreted protein n=1 Tax=Stachybotrys elegans TaxID=80388 RepID=A0A8K0WK00_9HYPO|nr:hypothetical protein B0I35DRAFT_444720 [Stachybotrys elegans]